ncbi:unnamed protein product [Cylindrotheca closterium]|uniref:Protein kinase domain-containing protein n=1 Tax=Cylindrotheca closterium TaxID=2856 RepID=A0AAD2FLA8_9STRA|nr:unnamed protein product [Cylindrotheca closterium]
MMSRRITSKESSSRGQAHVETIRRSASKEKKVHGQHSLFGGSATRKLLVARYYLERKSRSLLLIALCLAVLVLLMTGKTLDEAATIPFSSFLLLRNKEPSVIQRIDFTFHKPRTLEISSDLLDTINNITSLRDPILGYNTNDTIEVSPAHEKFKEHLENSKRYNRWQRDPIRTEECEPMHPWQETLFPSCLDFHAMDLQKDLRAITDGGYNSVFRITDIDGSHHIMKILKYGDTKHTDRNFDRVRRDSLVMERATGSPYVMDIYGYCGFSQVVPVGRHGDLNGILRGYYDQLSQGQKLEIATQVAQALADVHDLDGDGISSMSHGDFASKQYILIDGRFKLNDFNRGRFIRWNPTLNEPCPYTIEKNGDKFRAPEEYKHVPQTAAIDVWALGSVFVQIVTGHGIWNNYDSEEAQHYIVEGIRYPMDRSSTDPIDQVLYKAIDMCQVYEAKDRPKAGEVLEYLKAEAKRLDVEWDKPFGE